MTTHNEDVRMPDTSESNDAKKSGATDDEHNHLSPSKPLPQFPRVRAVTVNGVEYRRVRCPPHRYTPLRENWQQILTPLVEYLKLQVR
jgi:RNA-binding protein PNO1